MIINPHYSATEHNIADRPNQNQDRKGTSLTDIPIPAANPVDHPEEPLPPSGREAAVTAVAEPGEKKADRLGEIYATFPPLVDLSPDKFAYGEIFPITSGRDPRTRQNKRLIKILMAVHALLTTRILQEDEQVMLLAKGIAYYRAEIPYANGLLTMLSNYFAIACTNKRLLLINIDWRTSRPTRYIFQIPYGEISKVSRGALGSSIIIENQAGRRWNFTTVGRNHAKAIKNFILGKSTPVAAKQVEETSLCQLCPSCYTALPGGLPACPHCAAHFKKRTEAMIRALILPGLGSIYLSYLPLGLLEMAGYLAAWLLGVVLLIVQAPGGIASAIAPVLTYHLITGILALQQADKGYVLESP